MARILVPRRAQGLALNMRNSSISDKCMQFFGHSLRDSKMYLTALDLRYCYLTFDDVLTLADAMPLNVTLVKLDLGNNALKQCVVKFLLEALIDNTCLTELRLASNLLDDEFAVDIAILLEQNTILHTIDISNNPIGPDGAQYLLQSLLQYNDNIESLGDLQLNDYMGVRNRHELKQTLDLNLSNHQRKRIIMNKIEETKRKAVKEKNVLIQDPVAKSEEPKKLKDEDLTIQEQQKYPLLKPIAFSNAFEDDYLCSGIWNLKPLLDPQEGTCDYHKKI